MGPIHLINFLLSGIPRSPPALPPYPHQTAWPPQASSWACQMGPIHFINFLLSGIPRSPPALPPYPHQTAWPPQASSCIHGLAKWAPFISLFFCCLGYHVLHPLFPPILTRRPGLRKRAHASMGLPNGPHSFHYFFAVWDTTFSTRSSPLSSPDGLASASELMHPWACQMGPIHFINFLLSGIPRSPPALPPILTRRPCLRKRAHGLAKWAPFISLIFCCLGYHVLHPLFPPILTRRPGLRKRAHASMGLPNGPHSFH